MLGYKISGERRSSRRDVRVHVTTCSRRNLGVCMHVTTCESTSWLFREAHKSTTATLLHRGVTSLHEIKGRTTSLRGEGLQMGHYHVVTWEPQVTTWGSSWGACRVHHDMLCMSQRAFLQASFTTSLIPLPHLICSIPNLDTSCSFLRSLALSTP